MITMYWNEQKMQRRFNRIGRSTHRVMNAYTSGYRFSGMDKALLFSYGAYEVAGFLNDLFFNGSYSWLGSLFR